MQSIPLAQPDVTEAEVQAVRRVLESSALSMGPQIAEFENAFASLVGRKHAIGVSSGTAALHVSLIAAGVGDGDLVITTPFSFVASANSILYQRAVPVFVDVQPGTLNIDPQAVEEAVEALNGKGKSSSRWLPPALQDTRPGRLAALLPVDVFGQPAAVERLQAVAHRHGLPFIEDACEAVGAERNGTAAGALGDAAVFAFYPNKQVTTGEGGMVVTDRDDWAEVIRSLRNQGRGRGGSWLSHERLGYNYRLDEMSAALGVVQMQRLDELIERRARVAAMYAERLGNATELSLPFVEPATTRMSWFVYVVRLADRFDRDAISRCLEGQGVPTRPYFAPIHLQPFYRKLFGYRGGEFPVTEQMGRSSLALPFFSTMTESQVDYVCERLLAALRD